MDETLTITENATSPMKAFVFDEGGSVRSITEPRPTPGAGEVLVKVDFLGICGTDVHLMHGSSSYVRGGLTTYPIRFGHEWSGRIDSVGVGVDSFQPGDRVVGEPFLSCGQCLTCRGGHYNLCPSRRELGVRGDASGAAAEYLRIPVGNVHKIPEGVDLHAAVLAEPSVTVLSSFELGAVQPGEKVAVIGTGTMGLIAVQVAAYMGCRVDAIGIVPSELVTAKAQGAWAAIQPDEAHDSAYDVVIEASGSSRIGPLMCRIAAIGGRLLQLGIPGEAVDGLDLAAFVMKGLSLRGVLGGVDLMPRALELMSIGAIRPEQLIDHVFDQSELSDALEMASKGGRLRPKVLVDMSTLSS